MGYCYSQRNKKPHKVRTSWPKKPDMSKDKMYLCICSNPHCRKEFYRHKFDLIRTLKCKRFRNSFCSRACHQYNEKLKAKAKEFGNLTYWR